MLSDLLAFVLYCKVSFSAASWLDCQKILTTCCRWSCTQNQWQAITGVDMRQLLLLLPFLLFDLLEDEIEQHNATIDKSMPSIHCLGFDTLGVVSPV